ncbi:hypothetical protein NDK43_25855 [Neobacillus pocheonensis]|uniref:Uncharacterized protein n=1 Tax=Neobacillus pocheonensis TaxID=363869 RepID=A0ABT0WFR8_9BACI|nr:hypothetical protein [Neobacillus pocheonensis]
MTEVKIKPISENTFLVQGFYGPYGNHPKYLAFEWNIRVVPEKVSYDVGRYFVSEIKVIKDSMVRG